VRSALIAGISAIAVAATWVAVASPATTIGPEVQVSGTSPLPEDCGTNPGVPAGTNTPDGEVEPWVDVNPIDANNIVAFWQQGRWSNGGARSLVAGDEVTLTETSFDILQAPLAGELFLGDYVGLASDGTDFLSVFVKSDDPAGDAATVFFRRLQSPAEIAANP